MLIVHPDDKALRRGRFKGGQVATRKGGPQKVAGVAIESIKITRIHQRPDARAIRDLLLAKMKLEPSPKGELATLVSDNPLARRRPTGPLRDPPTSPALSANTIGNLGCLFR